MGCGGAGYTEGPRSRTRHARVGTFCGWGEQPTQVGNTCDLYKSILENIYIFLLYNIHTSEMHV